MTKEEREKAFDKTVRKFQGKMRVIGDGERISLTIDKNYSVILDHYTLVNVEMVNQRCSIGSKIPPKSSLIFTIEPIGLVRCIHKRRKNV